MRVKALRLYYCKAARSLYTQRKISLLNTNGNLNVFTDINKSAAAAMNRLDDKAFPESLLANRTFYNQQAISINNKAP